MKRILHLRVSHLFAIGFSVLCLGANSVFAQEIEGSPASARVEASDAINLIDLPEKDVPLSELREKSEESYFPRNLDELMAQEDDESDGVDYSFVAKRAVTLMETNHLLKLKTDDELSAKVLEDYLAVLDPTNLFFTQPDVDRFEERYKTTLDDKMKAGDIKAAYEIFEIYEKSVTEILEEVEEILWGETFPFGASESRATDRSDEPRPKNKADRIQIWRDVITTEFLRDLMRRGDEVTSEELAELKSNLLSGYRRLYKTSQQHESEDIAAKFIKSFASAFDSPSDFYSPAEVIDNRIAAQNSLTGIGATLQIDQEGFLSVVSLVPGGPAAVSGKLRSGDKIVGVGEGPGGELFRTRNQRLRESVQRIRGEAGTRVRLEIISTEGTGEESKSTLLLERGKIELQQSRARAELFAIPSPSGTDNYVGWIDIPRFYGEVDPETSPSVSHDLRLLIERLKGERVDTIILNLSENSGGSMGEVSAIGGLFLGSRTLGLTRANDGNPTVDNTEEENPIWDGPLVIQTGRTTASGSEILASALQDHRRAVIIGEARTYGLGTAARFYAVAEDGSESLGYLAITTNMNFRVSGQSNHLVGVTPDILIPSSNDTAFFGPESLRNPVAAQEIPGTEYEPWSEESLPLVKLRVNSISRILQDVELQQIAKDNLLAQDREDRNETSLEVGVRVAQREQSRERSEEKAEALRGYYDTIRAEYEEEMRAWNIPISRIDDRRLQLLSEAKQEDLTGIIGGGAKESDGPVPPLGFDSAKREAIAVAMDLMELSDYGD